MILFLEFTTTVAQPTMKDNLFAAAAIIEFMLEKQQNALYVEKYQKQKQKDYHQLQ